jgi:hypothetical protein
MPRCQHADFIRGLMNELRYWSWRRKPLTKEQAIKLKEDYKESNEVIYRLRKKWGIQNLDKLRQQQRRRRITREKCREYYQKNKHKIKVQQCLKSD